MQFCSPSDKSSLYGTGVPHLNNQPDGVLVWLYFTSSTNEKIIHMNFRLDLL